LAKAVSEVVGIEGEGLAIMRGYFCAAMLALSLPAQAAPLTLACEGTITTGQNNEHIEQLSQGIVVDLDNRTVKGLSAGAAQYIRWKRKLSVLNPVTAASGRTFSVALIGLPVSCGLPALCKHGA
jgi:hypothetical protein